MQRKKSVRGIDVNDMTVLLRADFNVTFCPGTTSISDDSRIQATLPTIRYLQSRNAKVVLCSHIGRPGGRAVPELRMQPVSERLSGLLGSPVVQADGSVDDDVRAKVRAMKSGEIVMLENIRFSPGEERNDPAFARDLASLADIFVNDAFGAAHRAHASTVGVTCCLPSVAGLLMERELEMLGAVLEAPAHPLVVIIGGAKVSDKLPVVKNLIGRAETLIVGGGMAATFLRSQELDVGDSPVEGDLVGWAGEIMRSAEAGGTAVLLPSDVVISSSFAADAAHRITHVSRIEPGWRIMDIGPDTSRRYVRAVFDAGTVVWNGTMGVFEWESFSAGTKRLARALSYLDGATTVIGGGSTSDAVAGMGLAEKMTHVSTGGGASLEFLEGKELPGVAGLLDAE